MRFDLFLSHNADEKRIVSAVAERLLDEFDVRCWLDEWDLRAGSDWHAAIEEALRTCRGCAIFLGGAGWGEAHLHEARTALELAREDPAFLVIPVLLPGASDEAMGVLADFFARTHRIGLGAGARDDAALRRLARAVHGQAQGPPALTAFTIRRDARRWDASAKADSSLLYRGSALREAQRIALDVGSDLGSTELRFLTASAEEEKRIIDGEQRRSRRVITGLLSLIAALALAVAWALAQRRGAQDQAYLAGAEQQIAFSRKIVAERQRAAAESQRRHAQRQMQRAAAANLAELGQRLYADEPLVALRLTVEALASAPADDEELSDRVLRSLSEMLRTGRLVRIATAAAAPIPVPDTDFFVLNEADRTTLRRRYDGSVVTELFSKVEAIVTEARKPPEERAPFFLVKYGYQQQEMRRNSDASVVTEFSVESVTATRTPFVLVQYFGGEAELRRADDDRRAVSLSAPKPEVKPVDRARFFVVTYPSAPLEVRSSSSGQVLATLPGGDGLEGKSADDRVFAVRYRANGKRIALFDGGGQWISLPSVPTAVVFDPSHSRYVVIYDDRNAELRRSNGAGIDELPAPVKEAVFAGDHLILLYRNSNVEIRDGLGAVTATDSGVSTIDEIPATGSVLLRRGKSPAKLVHLKTNTWREMPPIGWIDRKLAPTNAGSLHFFVAQKMIGSEARSTCGMPRWGIVR